MEPHRGTHVLTLTIASVRDNKILIHCSLVYLYIALTFAAVYRSLFYLEPFFCLFASPRAHVAPVLSVNVSGHVRVCTQFFALLCRFLIQAGTLSQNAYLRMWDNSTVLPCKSLYFSHVCLLHVRWDLAGLPLPWIFFWLIRLLSAPHDFSYQNRRIHEPCNRVFQHVSKFMDRRSFENSRQPARDSYSFHYVHAQFPRIYLTNISIKSPHKPKIYRPHADIGKYC